MADLPILFSTPMVQALLAGRKTQTRRGLPIATPVQSKIEEFVKVGTDKAGRSVYEMRDKNGSHVHLPAQPGCVTPHFIPRIGVGYRLYVREAWRVSSKHDACSPAKSHKGAPVLEPRAMTVFFEAGGSIANFDFPAHEIHTRSFDQTRGLIPETEWRPDESPAFGEMPAWAGKVRQAMHMPRWASRITLVVTDVRVERLQAISKEDALAEGAPVDDGFAMVRTGPESWISPVAWYRRLWDEINGAGAWQANPWVAAYSFTFHLGNIDDVRL